MKLKISKYFKISQMQRVREILRLTKRERERERVREVARDEMQSILKLGQKSLIPVIL